MGLSRVVFGSSTLLKKLDLPNALRLSIRACVYQKKFGEKMTGEIECEKGHTYIPMEVRTQKARLACVTAGSNAGQIVSCAGLAGSVIP